MLRNNANWRKLKMAIHYYDGGGGGCDFASDAEFVAQVVTDKAVAPSHMALASPLSATNINVENDEWISGDNYAGTDVVNMLKVNTDDEIDVGGQLNIGSSIEGPEDGGKIVLFDMPVSSTPSSGDEMSASLGIDSDTCIEIGAYADGAGGVTGHFFKMLGAVHNHKTDSGAADYNPSALTSDHIITVDTTAAARAVTISTEDRDTGTADNPRIFIVKDIAGNAGTNNITVSLETAGNIDGAATAVINANYNSITLMIDGTNGYII